jgi:beta-N-acetylhexosaminidase
MIRVEELARGIVIAGITGTRIDARLPRFGGYLLFAHDGAGVGEVRALTDALRRREDDLAPLIAIDQEGGRVARLRVGVEAIPSMMAVGAAGDLELAQRAGEQTAFDLRRAGCTMDFAPVLDLALDPRNTVIGTRSFGVEPTQVAALGSAFGRGLNRGGILPCYKHFPGHGATAIDSHQALPIVDADETLLRERDLVPFAAVAQSAPAVMSGHVLVPAFDSQHPATLSHRIATDLLRGELGFRGAFVTDCLEMDAVALADSVGKAVDALVAGADLLVFSHDLELAVAAVAEIERAARDGRVAVERLEEAYGRVRRLREAGARPLALDAFPPHPGVGREIARDAVTLVRGVAHADPLASILVSFGGPTTALQHEAPALQGVAADIDADAEQSRAALDSIEKSRRRPIILARRAHLHPGQADAIRRIMQRYPDALAVSMLEPFDLPFFESARHLVAIYGDDAASLGGLADVVFGGSMPAGRLPVSL